MRIELNAEWPERIKAYLKHQIKKVNPATGWWWDDCRYDDEFGIAGEVIQDYDASRHDSVESLLIPLKSLPIVPPYGEEEPIKTEQELMEYIQLVIIEEFSTIDCGEWPDLKLVAGYCIRLEYGSKIHSAPARFLEVNFEFETIRR